MGVGNLARVVGAFVSSLDVMDLSHVLLGIVTTESVRLSCVARFGADTLRLSRWNGAVAILVAMTSACSGVGASDPLPSAAQRDRNEEPDETGDGLPTTAVRDAADGGEPSESQNMDGSGSEDSSREATPNTPTRGDVVDSQLTIGEGVGPMGMRRLTIAELDNTLESLLSDSTRPARQTLQEEQLGPFNNDYTRFTVSSVLIEGLERLAFDVTSRLLTDAERRDAVVGCVPMSPTQLDSSCLRQFITTFGRRALRRPLTVDEVDAFELAAEPFVTRTGDFYAAVEVALRAFLQHPQFLYRVEIGDAVDGEPGLFKLDDFEMATRLSYTLWSEPPSDGLLDLAEQGELSTAADVRTAALQMLDSPRVVDNLDQFHALWLGYSVLPHPQALTTAMRTESRKLVERTFEMGGSWLDLFRATDTYVDATLAEVYALPQPIGGSGWVSYGDTGRQGILSHGSFLSFIQDTTDTSPVRRGERVRAQLMCQPVPPPPANVNASTPSRGDSGSLCKTDRYADHRAQSGCEGCHRLMDPVGFGLENFDREGRYRTHDIDTLDGSPTFGMVLDDCPISGEGDLDGTSFTGPAGLADILIRSDVVGPCVATQFFRFAMGREELTEDEPALDEYKERFKSSGYDFRELLLGLVSSKAFGYRREETL